MHSLVRQFNFPTIIRYGSGALFEVADHLKTDGIHRPLVVTESECAAQNFFEDLISDLNIKGIKAEVFQDVRNPLQRSDSEVGVEVFKSKQCDSILAVGASAALTTARAIRFLCNHQDRLEHYDEEHGGEKNIINTLPHLVSIPVAASGEETSRVINFRAETSMEKIPIFSPRLISTVVFADPVATLWLPKKKINEWKMAVFSILTESWLSVMHHPICAAIAIEGLTGLLDEIREEKRENVITYHQQILEASIMAGISRQKGQGAISAMAETISACSGCNFGEVCSILFPSIIRFEIDKCGKSLLQLAKRLGWREKNEEAVAERLIGWTENLNLPKKLSAIGLYPDDVDVLADLSFSDITHRDGPKQITRSEMKSILQNLF